MAIKFESHNYAADQDLLESAQECCDLFEQMKSCGAELNELVAVMDNIVFARDTIKAHGAKWYLENCDPMNALGQAIDVAQESLSVKTVEAGLEGVMGDVWGKIKEFFEKIVNWITGLFSNKTAEKAEANEHAAKAAVEKISNQTAEERKAADNAIQQKKAPAASKKLASTISKLAGDTADKAKSGTEKATEYVKAEALPAVIGLVKKIIPERKTYKQKLDELDAKYQAEASKPEADPTVIDNLFNEMQTLNQDHENMFKKMIEEAKIDMSSEGTMAAIGIRSVQDLISAINRSGGTVANAKECDNFGTGFTGTAKKFWSWIKSKVTKEDDETKAVKFLKKFAELQTKLAQEASRTADLNLQVSEMMKQLGDAGANSGKTKSE